MKTIETSKGGSLISRYEHTPQRSPEIVSGDNSLIEEIGNHIETHLGPISVVIHEIISDGVHIDIHIVAPQKDRNFYTLVTSGMSQKPQVLQTPDGEMEVYTELMLSLPPEWKLTEEDWKDTNYYWPIEWMSKLARFPHTYNTCLFDGHSIPNGDPAKPLADNTGFIGFIVGFPYLPPQDFILLKKGTETTIFFALYPVYQDEMTYKLEMGADKFCELALASNLTELIDIKRKSVVKKKRFFQSIFNRN